MENMKKIPDEPVDLARWPIAVWLKDGAVAIDFRLPEDVCDAMDLPYGSSAGYTMKTARARDIGNDLLAAATQAGDLPAQDPPSSSLDALNDRINQISEAESKDSLARMLVGVARFMLDARPGIDCTLSELLSHAAGRARKAQHH